MLYPSPMRDIDEEFEGTEFGFFAVLLASIVATGAFDQVIRLWSRASGQLLRTLTANIPVGALGIGLSERVAWGHSDCGRVCVAIRHRS